VWSAKSGKNIEAASLDQYKRMAERTPIEYRNPKADPTAYLAISTAKAPRKEEKEDQKAFDARLAKFEADREELQKKLAVGELVKRKEIVPLVNEMLVKHGMKEAIDPNAAPAISISQQFALFFHATFALEELLSVHKDGLIIYKEGADLIEVTKEEMEAKLASAKANLVNALYSSEKLGLTPADYIKGYKETIAKVEVTKDADGKPVYEDTKVKNFVYPLPFFEVEKKATEPAATEAPAETPAEPVEEKKTKAKK
jgi:ribosomal protein S10